MVTRADLETRAFQEKAVPRSIDSTYENNKEGKTRRQFLRLIVLGVAGAATTLIAGKYAFDSTGFGVNYDFDDDLKAPEGATGRRIVRLDTVAYQGGSAVISEREEFSTPTRNIYKLRVVEFRGSGIPFLGERIDQTFENSELFPRIIGKTGHKYDIKLQKTKLEFFTDTEDLYGGIAYYKGLEVVREV